MSAIKTQYHDHLNASDGRFVDDHYDALLDEASRTPMTRPVLPVECEATPSTYTTIDNGTVRMTVSTNDIDTVARRISHEAGTCGHDGTPLLPFDKAREIVKEAAALLTDDHPEALLQKAVDQHYTEAAENVEKSRTTYTERRAA